MKYFIYKLKILNRNLEEISAALVKGIAERTPRELVNLADSLQRRKGELHTITREIPAFVSVQEVIELKNKFDLDTNALHYAYKYNTSVTVAERDLLVLELGYQFKDIRVK